MDARYELALFVETGLHYNNLSLLMFVTSLLLFMFFGCLQNASFIQVLSGSSRDVGAVMMVVCLLNSFISTDWWEAGIMLLMISAIGLVMEFVEKRTVLIKHYIAVWVHVLALGFAVTIIYAAFKPLPTLMYYVGSAEAIGFIL